jgi:ketosteroid isomerase-like protein
MTAFVVGLIAPASAQKAEIEAVNAKWIEFFNRGDFAGVASLYTTDATAFPQGSAMVQGGAAIGLGQCSKTWRKELAIRN